jgi:peptidoglycan-binding domain 1 protein
MKLRKTFISCFLISNLVGCSLSPTNLKDDRPYIGSTTTHNSPAVEPVRAMTSFSDSLNCMDDLLRQTGLGETVVAVKTVKDPSGKAAAAVNEMIVTALSQMSRTSGAFKVVDFEVDPLKQDTVQTLTNLLLPTGSMQIPAPQLYISGAVSYVDQNVLRKSNSAGVSYGEDGELGVSNDLMTTALGLELHIGDFLTRTLYPGIDSANEIVAAAKGLGVDAGARISKTGVQFSFERNLSQGIGGAIRTLVDLGTIELVGKLSKVPYWQCLSLDQAHPEFQRELLDWYGGMGEREKIKFFQTGLRNLGYYNGSANGKSTIEFRQALSAFQKDNNATPSGFINFESYERLMKNYVRADANGNFKKVGMTASNTNDKENEPREGYPYFYSDKESPINVAIRLDKPTYNRGDSLQLDIAVDNDSTYLACFYQDTSNTISQIYPNPLEPERLVSKNNPLKIPDSDAFNLSLSKKGKESVMCMASYYSVTDKLNNNLGAAFQPLKVKNMEQLANQLKSIFGEDIKGIRTVNYQVK